ncbi:hypothetical protein [Amycolatopsis sp. NBC_01480]|uniref:hypothetical protein n=1 Tax=Amycolatopsis sp. NBC_01480 TaxID=2903562 RepID=UPI002E2AEF91|nr:hypothetical protein [Amycolatopsis sp. NBC_01480]
MPKNQREVRIRGTQREVIDADLMAQIVIMLGRQLKQETMTDTAPDMAENDDQDDGSTS